MRKALVVEDDVDIVELVSLYLGKDGWDVESVADGKRAIVGSINLSPGSFDSRRELAIETKSKSVLKRLVQVSRRDWKHSQRIDLSDAGILADLEKHGSKDANLLALGQ